MHAKTPLWMEERYHGRLLDRLDGRHEKFVGIERVMTREKHIDVIMRHPAVRWHCIIDEFPPQLR